MSDDTEPSRMRDDPEIQSTLPTNSRQDQTAPVLTRRTFLKSATVSGFVGAMATDGTADARSSSVSTKSVCGNQKYENSLRVEGLGSGLNHYHLETSGDIVQQDLVNDLQGIGDGVVEGTVRKGDTDLYRYSGVVRTVWAKGSVTYSITDVSDK